MINDAATARGGATALALASAVGLRARGLPVTLLCGDAGDNPDLAARDIGVVPLDQRPLLEAGGPAVALRGLYNPRAAAMLRGWIRANDDPGTVYHLHTWSRILSPAVFAALRPVRDRLVITAHDFFLTCPNGAYAFFDTGAPCTLRPLGPRCIVARCDKRSYPHKLWRVARQGVQASLLHYGTRGPRVLAIHAAMREPLERGGVPARAITVLPNPVVPWRAERIDAEANREILFVGRLAAEKGPDLAARAARRAGVPLRIAGDGPLRAPLSAAFPEVAFAGQQDHAGLAALAARARALVVPSRYPEPFGLVVAEALWSGLPVVIAQTALAAPALVADGAGLACDPRDEAALAGALGRLAADDALVARLSRNALASRDRLGLAPEAWLDALLAVYEAALGGPPPGGA